MRNNQPITQREYPLPAGTALLSYTDTKGRIMRGNDAFIEVSGFAEDELVGQPHNIVRHPDMPEEAFRDLWATLKSGRPWSGLVKNRRKDGDHYWVRATASPSMDGGYMSVRTPPSVDDVRAAETLYAKMRGNSRIRLSAGQVCMPGPIPSLKRALGRFTMAQRLWGWAVFSLLMLCIAMGFGWNGLRVAHEDMESIYNDRLVPIEQLAVITEKQVENYAEVLSILQHNPADPLASLHDHPIQVHLDTINANSAEVDKQWKAYMASYLTDEEKTLAADFTEKREAWRNQFQKSLSQFAAGNFDPREVKTLFDAKDTLFPKALEASEKLIQYQGTVAKAEVNAAGVLYTRTTQLYLVILVVGTAVSLWIAIGVIRRLNAGLTLAANAANAIAVGDLSRPVPSFGEDEIGQLLDKMAIMRNSVHELLADLQGTIRKLNTNAKELSAAASNSSTVASQQSEASSSMAAAVEELSVSIDQVEAHSADARRVTQASAENSASSGSVIQNTAQEMNRIAEAVTRTAESIRGLESVSGNISSIVNVIREIADQTNLLALNAAIEAARAGEQGRGFAVVADEVRKLAERTATSTNEIATMITQIQEGSRAASASMEASVARVADGVRLAAEAGESISQIRASTGEVTAAVDSIGFTLKEQATATREIAGRVENISHGTEELSASARQTAEAARELEVIAGNMESLAKRFRVA